MSYALRIWKKAPKQFTKAVMLNSTSTRAKRFKCDPQTSVVESTIRNGRFTWNDLSKVTKCCKQKLQNIACQVLIQINSSFRLQRLLKSSLSSSIFLTEEKASSFQVSLEIQRNYGRWLLAFAKRYVSWKKFSTTRLLSYTHFIIISI